MLKHKLIIAILLFFATVSSGYCDSWFLKPLAAGAIMGSDDSCVYYIPWDNNSKSRVPLTRLNPANNEKEAVWDRRDLTDGGVFYQGTDRPVLFGYDEMVYLGKGPDGKELIHIFTPDPGFRMHIVISPKLSGYDVLAYDVDETKNQTWEILYDNQGSFYYCTDGKIRPFRWTNVTRQIDKPLPSPVREIPANAILLNPNLDSLVWLEREGYNWHKASTDSRELAVEIPQGLIYKQLITGLDNNYYLADSNEIHAYDANSGRWKLIYKTSLKLKDDNPFNRENEIIQDLFILADGTIVFERNWPGNNLHTWQMMILSKQPFFDINPAPETLVSSEINEIVLNFDSFLEYPLPQESDLYLVDAWGNQVSCNLEMDRNTGLFTLKPGSKLEPGLNYYVYLEHPVKSGDDILCEKLVSSFQIRQK